MGKSRIPDQLGHLPYNRWDVLHVPLPGTCPCSRVWAPQPGFGTWPSLPAPLLSKSSTHSLHSHLKLVLPHGPGRLDESPKTELSVKWWKVLLMEEPCREIKDNKRRSNSSMIPQLLKLLCREVVFEMLLLVWREMWSPSVRDNSLKKPLRQVC